MNVYINSQWSKVLEHLYFDYQEHKLENKLILYTTLFHQSKFCKGLFYLMKLLCKIIIYTFAYDMFNLLDWKLTIINWIRIFAYENSTWSFCLYIWYISALSHVIYMFIRCKIRNECGVTGHNSSRIEEIYFFMRK